LIKRLQEYHLSACSHIANIHHHNIVSNNLPLRTSESLFFRLLVSHLNSTTLVIGRTTIGRDLQRIFCILKQDYNLNYSSILHKVDGLPTDTWSARNYFEFVAVTAHWISDKWQLRHTVLDVIELQEPIHSGEYLAQQLIAVTDYGITPAVFTITRDNKSLVKKRHRPRPEGKFDLEWSEVSEFASPKDDTWEKIMKQTSP
jgi:hypothetical protein